jgi:hypothetical protein
VAADRIREVRQELSERGLLVGGDGSSQLTPAGRQHAQRLLSARSDLLAEALADDSAHRYSELSELLHRLARELSGEPPVSSGLHGRA